MNSAYFARPDNSGLALFRYAAHAEVAVWKKRLALGVDGTMFTDRRTNVIRPSELDLTLMAIVRAFGAELQIAYERDMPVDRGGLMQHFLYTLAAVPFEIVSAPAELAGGARGGYGRARHFL